VIIVGMKTQCCVDSTCRAARDLGFDAVLIADGHTCSDMPVMSAKDIVAHHNATLGRKRSSTGDSNRSKRPLIPHLAASSPWVTRFTLNSPLDFPTVLGLLWQVGYRFTGNWF
jgi:hypothetical protein